MYELRSAASLEAVEVSGMTAADVELGEAAVFGEGKAAGEAGVLCAPDAPCTSRGRIFKIGRAGMRSAAVFECRI